eukprot:1137981-Pelagomonas_calceolata.AAC.2
MTFESLDCPPETTYLFSGTPSPFSETTGPLETTPLEAASGGGVIGQGVGNDAIVQHAHHHYQDLLLHKETKHGRFGSDAPMQHVPLKTNEPQLTFTNEGPINQDFPRGGVLSTEFDHKRVSPTKGLKRTNESFVLVSLIQEEAIGRTWQICLHKTRSPQCAQCATGVPAGRSLER